MERLVSTVQTKFVNKIWNAFSDRLYHFGTFADMNKVIVTGGAGFIGSHTVVSLIEQGYEVVIIDNLYNSQIEVIDGIKSITNQMPIFEQVDLVDQKACKKVFKKHSDAKTVIHFAAYKSVPESVSKPQKYYKNNIESLLNVTSNMALNGISNLIFSSSCTVYGQPDKLPVVESTSWQHANTPYGHTKQLGEMILKNMSALEKTSLKVVSLRYFNPIGAHESALIGELPLGIPDNLLPYITQTAAGLRDQLSVFGSDYPTPDGTAVRDYIHVCDLADAHVKAIKYVDKSSSESYTVFNIGTGIGYSVLDIIRSFEKTNNLSLNYKIDDRRPGDIAEIYADPSQANDILGWQAKRSLDDMTRSAWKWQLSL